MDVSNEESNRFSTGIEFCVTISCTRIRFAVSFIVDDVGESDRGRMEDRIM